MENILSEYDKSPGIISPDFEKMDLHLPKKAVFAFLGEKRIERFAFARGGEKVRTFVSLTKDFPLWMIKADKEELCVLQAPAGASAADIVEGVLRENHVPCENGVTWSTDGFFRETKEKVKARRAEGCRVVDMECAALAACAAYRGKVFAQILLPPIHFTIYLTNSGRGEKKAAIRRSSWESKRRRGYEGRVMSAGELLFGGLLAVNAAAFFLYGLDKWKAVYGRRRIRK